MKIVLGSKPLTLEAAHLISSGAPLSMDPAAKKAIEKSRAYVAAIAKTDRPFYGINTGFGYLANKSIGSEQLAKLQNNIIMSHASGWGNPLPLRDTRLAMALRLNVLLMGMTGVRYTLCEALFKLINAQVYPLIPEHGSVGASGDLAPLAHLALPLLGLGKVSYKGKIITAKRALKAIGAEPLKLVEKEGIGLINGTQVMLAVGALALFDALKLIDLCDRTTALSYEALTASLDPLDPQIHSARGQLGQIASAKAIAGHLKGSYLHSKGLKLPRVQDPYSLRCAPQVHGASRDALSYAKEVVERELNGTTDNPLVFMENGGKVVSGGNFHGQPLGFAFDFAAIALSELSNIADRRLELLLNPHISGLHAFLAHHEGVESGYMAAQYLSSSLVSENKGLANPASTDSIPGNVGIEDHVSMGMRAARKFRAVVENCRTVIAIEALAAAQAIDLRGVHKLGKGTKPLYDAIRAVVPPLACDRIIAVDIEKAVKLFSSLEG